MQLPQKFMKRPQKYNERPNIFMKLSTNLWSSKKVQGAHQKCIQLFRNSRNFGEIHGTSTKFVELLINSPSFLKVSKHPRTSQNCKGQGRIYEGGTVGPWSRDSTFQGPPQNSTFNDKPDFRSLENCGWMSIC